MTEEEAVGTEDGAEVRINGVDDNRTGEDAGLDVPEEVEVDGRINGVEEGFKDDKMGVDDGSTREDEDEDTRAEEGDIEGEDGDWTGVEDGVGVGVWVTV